jgi:hypothetical protein
MRKCKLNGDWQKKKVPHDYDVPNLRQSILGKRRRGLRMMSKSIPWPEEPCKKPFEQKKRWKEEERTIGWVMIR